MSAFHNARSSASSAVLKLFSEFDQTVKSVGDLKNGSVLLNLFLELGLAPPKSFQNVKNPFQFMKKCIKKSSEKDFFQRVNLDQCEKGNEAELLFFSSCLLYRWHSQQKENALQASNVLSDQEAKILWSVWLELEPYSFSSEPSRSSLKCEPLKEYNFSPKSGSPYKRNIDTPCALKKEIHKKEICITNLRSLLDEEQERIVELLQAKKGNEQQISDLEKVVKEQKGKLSIFNETSKLTHDIEDFQQTIQSLMREKEKLLLRIKDLKDTKKEITVLEAENQDLRNIKDNLDEKVSNLESFNKRLANDLQDWQRKQCESVLLQQRLDILQEELKVKEDTIAELNSMIAVYQDKLDVQKNESSANIDLSDCGEVVGLMCSSFHNTSCELTSLQNEVNGLQHQKDILEADLKETKENLQKSANDNSKLEKEVDTLQKLIDHLNAEVRDNQVHINTLDRQLGVKDKCLADLTHEKDRLSSEVVKLVEEINGLQDQLVRLKDDQMKSLIVIQQHEEEIQKGKDEIMRLQSHLLFANQEKNELKEQVNNLDEIRNMLKSEVLNANSKIEQLFSELQDLENSICQLKLLNSEQEVFLVTLKNDKNSLECALVSLQEKHASLISCHEESTLEKEKVVSELNELHGTFSKLQEEQVNLQARLKDFNAENNRLQIKILHAGAENSRLLGISEQLKEEKINLSEELKNVQGQMSTVQSHNGSLQEKVDELILQRVELQKNISEMEMRHTVVCEKYDSALKTIDILNLQLTSTQRELENMRDLHNEINFSFSSLRNEHDALQEKYQSSMLQNETCSEKINSLQEQCNLAKQKALKDELRISELSESVKVAAEANDTLSFQNENLVKQKSMFMEKSVQLEQEVNSLQQMKNILSDQISELLNDKVSLQSKLKQREDRVDANTSTCSIPSFDDIDLEMNKSASAYCEIDTVIKELETQLTVSEERYKVDLIDKANENEELSRRIEMLLLDLKGKEKYMTYLELEKQQTLEKLNTSSVSFEKEIKDLHDDCKIKSVHFNKTIKGLQEELESITLLKENAFHEISECNKRICSLKDELDLTLAEKSDVIGALCEKEEALKVMQESINESKLANIEMAAIIDEKKKVVSNLEATMKLKSVQIEQLLSELENKSSELQKLSHVQGELLELRNKLVNCEDSYAKDLDMLRKEKDSVSAEKDSLNASLICKTAFTEELTEKLLNVSRANDMLVAETIQKANELRSLKEALKESTFEIQNLKSVIFCHEQNEDSLQDCVKNLKSQVELALKKGTDQGEEIEHLRNELKNSKQSVMEADQKVKSLEFRNDELCEEQHSLQIKVKEFEKEVLELKNVLLLQETKSSESIIQKQQEEVTTSPDNVDSVVHNPALKQWLDQFDSLSQKIQEMKNKYPNEVTLQSEAVNVPTISNFENEILTMIREHIHSWFTSTEFLFEENTSESRLFKKFSGQLQNPLTDNANDQDSTTNCDNADSSLNLVSSSVEAVASKETEKCKDCLANSESYLVLRKELKQRLGEKTAAQEKMLLIEKRFEAKERETVLYKEALSMCQQKIADLKQQQEVQKLKNREEVVQAKEQNNALQAKVEAAQNRLRDMERKYLDEMKVVHKKFQEKINLYNTTSKDLSQTKMQMVSLSKQHADLLEMYRRCEDKLMNANTALKKQRIENENLKMELRDIRRTVQQPKQQEINLRRMSFIPNSSFMQQSVCSTISGDSSFDSAVFIKPIVPASRFACDEEEGQFLDQSRNVSELKEGRVKIVDSISSKSRLEELQRRNTMCKPHMRTQYPVETQNMHDESTVCIKDLIHTPQVQKKNVRPSTSQPVPSTSNADKALEGQRKRKEWTQVPVDMSTPAKKISTVPSQPSSSVKKNHTKKAPFFKVFSPFRKEKPRSFSVELVKKK